jgi:beta-lactamase superfamily II metal-dependent hydrolase
MRTLSVLVFALFLVPSAVPPAYAQAPGGKRLQIHAIDVEGGQATLVVSPSGESLLIDTGWPGFDGRDAARIQDAMKQAGVSRVDYLLVTHYHTDHIGGVPALAARVPIGTFVDHGPTVESPTDARYTAYLETRKAGKHLQVKPGDKIPLTGLDVTVVSAAGDTIRSPLAGGGNSNALCANHKPQQDDASENARSVGIVIAYGAFRMADLGDLTWNKEHDLACPSNQVGVVDLYVVTHHGTETSGPPALVHALRPRVAIMNNGATKGGSPAAWHIVRDSPGLQDFWQLHTAIAGGRDANTAEQFIANVDETTAHSIKVSATDDGSFTVTNSRNNTTKTYGPRSGASR